MSERRGQRKKPTGIFTKPAPFVMLLFLGAILVFPMGSASSTMSNDYDRSVTNDAVNASIPFIGGASVPFGLNPGPINGAPPFSMNQTLSDQAQETTIAFDALAFLTGNLGADSFFPPGKVADFWGFQYLRDNDPSKMGHNTDFLTKAANNMLYALNETQQAELIALAKEQVNDINQYAMDRFVLMEGFRRLLQGDIPERSAGLDLNAIKNYSAQLYMLDGKISLERAEVMGSILNSLSTEQRAYLDGLKGKGMLEWPDLPDQLDKQSMSHDEHVAVMTYAGDMLSWYLGSIEADVYFCPERQGTYFGSFYLKDAPAIGNSNYTINETITGNSGALFLKELTDVQARQIRELVDLQRSYLTNIVEVRTNVSEQLRSYIDGDAPDLDSVINDMKTYGELDGAIIYLYATAFSNVNKSLSSEQRAAMSSLRAQLGVTVPEDAYLYSAPIQMPSIPSTDFLFLASTPSVPSDAPIGLMASAGDAQVTLTWSPPADDGGSEVIGYNLYRSTYSSGIYGLIASTPYMTYTDSGLSNGQTYWYMISAVNSAGAGANSTQVSAAPQKADSEYNIIIFVGIGVLALIAVAVVLLRMKR